MPDETISNAELIRTRIKYVLYKEISYGNVIKSEEVRVLNFEEKRAQVESAVISRV